MGQIAVLLQPRLHHIHRYMGSAEGFGVVYGGIWGPMGGIWGPMGGCGVLGGNMGCNGGI